MHQSFESPPHQPQAWWGHSLNVSVKASEVPRHQGKNTQLYKPKVPCVRIGCDSLS